jgi:LPXTG-site transpeptidase (sortase) family protein
MATRRISVIIKRAKLNQTNKHMQDIIPPKRFQRGAIRPQPRDSHSAAARRVVAGRAPQVQRSVDGFVGSNVTKTVTVTKQAVTTVEYTPRRVEQLSQTQKQLALERALSKAKIELRKERRRRINLKRTALSGLTVMMVLVTGYVSYDTWMTNSRAKEELTAQVSSSDVGVLGEDTRSEEGQDESDVSRASISNYAVAADLPRTITIDKLDVYARTLPMSINKDGSVQSPKNIFDAGWYTGSMKPGQIGASFINAHASGATRQGLFGNLDRLVVGDQLKVETGDGTTYTYQVVHTEIVPLDQVDMKKVLLPHGNTLKALNIMTCIGEWVQDKATFDHRVIVYTAQI